MEIPFNFSLKKYFHPFSLNYRKKKDHSNYINITNFHKSGFLRLILCWMSLLLLLVMTLQSDIFNRSDDLVLIFCYFLAIIVLFTVGGKFKGHLLIDIYFAVCILFMNSIIAERHVVIMIERIKINEDERLCINEDSIWRLVFVGIHIKVWNSFLNAAKVRWYIVAFCDLFINCLIIRHFITGYRINGKGDILLTIMLPSTLLPIIVSYLDERIYKCLILNLNRTKENLKSFEHLIENIIPNLIIILNAKSLKTEYSNAKATNFFKCETELSEKLKTVHIQGYPKTNLIEKCKNLTTELELHSCSIYEKGDASDDFINYEGTYLNESDQKYFFLVNVGHIKWRNEKVILILLKDVSSKIKLQTMKELNEYKDMLLASVSHDLRTPLNSIICFLELIFEEVKHTSQTCFDYVRAAQSSSKLLLYMINDILDYSQISNKKLKLSEEEFLCTKMVEDLLNIIDIQIKKKNLNFSYYIDETLHKQVITGDVNRIQQILLNLLVNAIKFTITGSITLSITREDCTFHAKTHKLVVFLVKDSGIGIDEQELPHIFAPFRKLESKLNSNGIGLGLSICQNLAKMMHEEGITVKSKKNFGSEFKFSVLIKDEKGKQENKWDGSCNVNTIKKSTENFECYQIPVKCLEKQENPENNLEERCNAAIIKNSIYNFDRFQMKMKNLKKPELHVYYELKADNFLKKEIKILIVDDDVLTLLIHKKYIENFGFQCETASNGAEAIQKIIENKEKSIFFSVVILDWNMPIMNGGECTKRIRNLIAENIIPDCALLVLSGKSFELPNGRKELKEAGINFFLIKPISKKKLLEKLMEILGRKS